MIKQVFFAVICFTILFSVQTTYAQEELSLPEGKNIKEWESISAALVVEKRFEEAIIYLDKVLDKEPDNLKALSNKASLLIQLERFSESISLSNKVLKVENPEEFELPKVSINSPYFFANQDQYFIYKNNYNKYVNYYKKTYQHGGVSLEEMLLPIITLESK